LTLQDAQLATLRTLAGAAARPDVRGWATVDLARAERELAEVSPHPRDAVTVPDDTVLGARCRLLRSVAGDADIVLLEPSTEGRLAASLARFGEGFLVRYVVVAEGFPDLARRAAAAGLALSRPAPGPLGTECLVLGGPAWGPHVVVSTDPNRQRPEA
jgi:hypothetical protein